MTSSLVVVLENSVVGTLELLAGGALQLTYDSGYAAQPAATPLSVSMPTAEPRWRGRVVTHWLRNLLPDDDRVLERWGTQFQVSPNSPFRLLEHVGRDVAGAVQFVPEGESGALDRGGVQWLTPGELARRLAELRADPAAWTPELAAGLFSLSGAQAKMALRYDVVADRWGMPYGAEPTTHILKPYGGGLPQQALNEHLSLNMAYHAGLSAARSQLLTIGGSTAISVKRYDRLVDGPTIRRVHQEDMCQALGLAPSQKYEYDGGPGIVRIVDLIRRVQGPGDASPDVDRFIQAQAFAWATAATDAHAKNYGLLLSGQGKQLTPLYDLHSAAPYFSGERRSVPPGRVSIHTAGVAMKIGGERTFDSIGRTHWIEVAESLRLPDEHVLSLVNDVVDRIPDAVTLASTPGDLGRRYTAEERAFVDTYVKQVTRRAKNAAAALRTNPVRSRGRRGTA